MPVVEKIRRTFIDIPRLIIAAVKDARNPLKVLPDNLQSAARRATHIEAKVDAQIAKENTIKSAFLLINSKNICKKDWSIDQSFLINLYRNKTKQTWKNTVDSVFCLS